MISRVGPRLRMCLRVVAVAGLLGIASGFAKAIIEGHSLSQSVGLGEWGLGAVQSYAFTNMLFFGVIYNFIAVAVTFIFDYEPNPRRFKLVMALAMLFLPLLLATHVVAEARRYPSLYDAADMLHVIAHVLGVLWLSQYISHNYLREIAAANQKDKRI